MTNNTKSDKSNSKKDNFSKEKNSSYKENFSKYADSFDLFTKAFQNQLSFLSDSNKTYTDSFTKLNQKALEIGEDFINNAQTWNNELASAKNPSQLAECSIIIHKEFFYSTVKAQQTLAGISVNIAKEMTDPINKQYESFTDLYKNLQK